MRIGTSSTWPKQLRISVLRPVGGVVLLLCLSTLLVLIWFGRGLLIASGESGLPFYNPAFFLKESSYLWSNELLGGAFPTQSAAFPFYFVLAHLSNLGVPSVALEAGTFWLILVAASISAYMLTLTVPGANQASATTAGIFYILNPYAVTAIWNRMLYTDMFAYALLPLALFLYLRGIESRQIKFSLYLNATTIAFAYAFGSLAFFIVFWLMILSASVLVWILDRCSKETARFVLRFTIMTIVVFVLLNSWWLLGLVTIASASSGSPSQVAMGPDVGTLLYYASVNAVTNVIRLIPPNWPSFAIAWDPALGSPGFLAISFLIPLISFSTLLFGTRRKQILFFSTLSVFGLVLANGAAPPIGGLFLFLYSRLPLAVLFRNPWEKLGVLYALPITPLFGIGLINISRRILGFGHSVRSSLLKRRLTVLGSICVPVGIIILLVGLLVWPMWTGRVFEGTSPPNPGDYVSVPQYYNEAKQWLLSQGGDFRVLVLPLGGEGTTYVWNDSGSNLGFNGVNEDNLLFGVPSISLPGTGAFSEVITKIPGFLVSNGTTFWKLMSVLSAKYVVLRDDTNFTYRGEISPTILGKALEATYGPSIVSNMVNVTSTHVQSLYDLTFSGSLASVWSDPTVLNFSAMASKQSMYGIDYQTETRLFPANNYSSAGVNYFLPPSEQDFNSTNFVEVWIKSNQTLNISIGLANSDDSSISWGDPTDNAYSIASAERGDWKLFVVRIANPSSTYKSFSLKSPVTRIGFAFFGSKTTVPLDIQIGGIFKDMGDSRETPYINFVRSFDRLHFYALEQDRFSPFVYPATQAVTATDSSDFINRVLPDPTFVPGHSVAVLPTSSMKQSVLEQMNGRSPEKPLLRFNQVNPAEYEISLSNVTGTFVLVLNQSFDPRWIASLERDAASQFGTVQVGQHLFVNGFANGWVIDGRGNATIDIRFQPEDILLYGSWISAMSTIALVTTLLFSTLVSFRKKIIVNGHGCEKS